MLCDGPVWECACPHRPRCQPGCGRADTPYAWVQAGVQRDTRRDLSIDRVIMASRNTHRLMRPRPRSVAVPSQTCPHGASGHSLRSRGANGRIVWVLVSAVERSSNSPKTRIGSQVHGWKSLSVLPPKSGAGQSYLCFPLSSTPLALPLSVCYPAAPWCFPPSSSITAEVPTPTRAISIIHDLSCQSLVTRRSLCWSIRNCGPVLGLYLTRSDINTKGVMC